MSFKCVRNCHCKQSRQYWKGEYCLGYPLEFTGNNKCKQVGFLQLYSRLRVKRIKQQDYKAQAKLLDDQTRCITNAQLLIMGISASLGNSSRFEREENKEHGGQKQTNLTIYCRQCCKLNCIEKRSSKCSSFLCVCNLQSRYQLMHLDLNHLSIA